MSIDKSPGKSPDKSPGDPSPRLRMSEPFQINQVKLKNRVLRSSLGGQLAGADGSVTNIWRNFERRFAKESGVAGLISATVSVDNDRYSPLYYPNLAFEHNLEPLRQALREIKDGTDCAYIVQLGDPGAHAQTSLLPQREDAKSASPVFDLLYGYSNAAVEMSAVDIERVVARFARAATLAQKAGCDGVEITASKGYLLHQFLNPATNRREDGYGGPKENRFRLVGEVIDAVRKAVGPSFLLGVRLSAKDVNSLPLNVRLPPKWPLREWLSGNGMEESVYYASEMKNLGVDYLHVSCGFGFINPKESPGDFPVDEVRRLFNGNRHLSRKAAFRATVLNALPDFLLRHLFSVGWNTKSLGENAGFAAELKRKTGLVVIANGGFQSKALIEDALTTCDMVSMARPLLANVDLLEQLKTQDEVSNPCTFCNRCSVLTATVPVGCYEPKRFGGYNAKMEEAVLRLVADPDKPAPVYDIR